MKLAAGWFKRVLTWLLGSLLVLIVLAIGALMYLGIPQNAAGMAAKGLCSAAFVAGRPRQDLMAQDVSPASPVLALIKADIDEASHSVTARFAGLISRRAVLLGNRGCVLDLEPDATAVAYTPVVDTDQPWPKGEVAIPVAQWGEGVDAQKLEQVAEQVFVGAGDPQAANARGFAVVQHGRMLVLRKPRALLRALACTAGR